MILLTINISVSKETECLARVRATELGSTLEQEFELNDDSAA